jgi:hypothetical protein
MKRHRHTPEQIVRKLSEELETLTASELDLTHAVNVRATLVLVKSFAAHRSGSGGGRSGTTPTGAMSRTSL